ncbi:MAG: hypothetical protein HY017_18895 [Betaproteobacteria bacterium]|nr:hypothetical protein [Betaproteobacteria bacterium]
MQSRFRALLLCLLAVPAICLDAAAQSIDAARTARDKAKADLIRAQDAFDRADESYINALGGAASKPTAKTAAPTPGGTRPGTVTFSLSGSRAVMINPLDFRGRLIVDGQPGAWTQHASGAKEFVPMGTYSLAYEVQNNERSDAINPQWKTICNGNLPLKTATIVDVALAQKITCNVMQ